MHPCKYSLKNLVVPNKNYTFAAPELNLIHNNYCQRNHDRFLIIDDVVYVFGASLKDAGKKLFAYIRMQETSASELLNNIR